MGGREGGYGGNDAPGDAAAGAGWDAGCPAWSGLTLHEATAAALRYRRDVVRALPSVLYVDDIAVGDAERGPEVHATPPPCTLNPKP